MKYSALTSIANIGVAAPAVRALNGLATEPWRNQYDKQLK
jgi:hypothetical protein